MATLIVPTGSKPCILYGWLFGLALAFLRLERGTDNYLLIITNWWIWAIGVINPLIKLCFNERRISKTLCLGLGNSFVILETGIFLIGDGTSDSLSKF